MAAEPSTTSVLAPNTVERPAPLATSPDAGLDRIASNQGHG